MTTYYYDLSAASNGTGTTANPFNGSVWPGAALAAGDSHLFKRGSSRAFSFTIGTAGTSGNYIKFGAWANADGSDNTALARPIITTTVQAMAFGAPKDYIWLDYLDVRATGMVSANDKSWVFLGTGGKVTNCIIDSNCGCIGAWDKDTITIANNTLKGVNTSGGNNVIALVNSAAHSGYDVYNNTIQHYGGGTNTSHAVACYCTVGGGVELLGLKLYNNTITTTTGTYNANESAIGIRILNCGNCDIYYNTVTYHQVGIFMAVGAGTVNTGAHVVGNVCNYNYHFGIGITSGTKGFTIYGNTCNYNGTSISDGTLQAYGRGIELSSAAGQSSCAGHAITYNTCKGNFNYGGPSDNASEGVGIGLDDGAVNCLVMSNTCTDNEGNGIQAYGGGNNATWTDTHNYIYSNVFKNNCTNSILSRRSGGTFRSGHFNADVALSYTHGAPSAVVNNTFGGGTAVGISTDGNCDQVQYGNNIYLFIGHPITTALTPASNDYRNSIFRAPTQKYSTTDVDANGEATFPALSNGAGLAYSGSADFTNIPGIDANFHIISTGSNAYRGGVFFSVGTSPAYVDHEGKSFNVIGLAPSIGAFEFDPNTNCLGGRERKIVTRNR